MSVKISFYGESWFARWRDRNPLRKLWFGSQSLIQIITIFLKRFIFNNLLAIHATREECLERMCLFVYWILWLQLGSSLPELGWPLCNSINTLTKLTPLSRFSIISKNKASVVFSHILVILQMKSILFIENKWKIDDQVDRSLQFT